MIRQSRTLTRRSQKRRNTVNFSQIISNQIPTIQHGFIVRNQKSVENKICNKLVLATTQTYVDFKA